jgi:hypothetical protein
MKPARERYELAISASGEFAHLQLSNLNNSLQEHNFPVVKQPFFYLFSFTGMPASPHQKSFFGLSFGSAQSKNDHSGYLTKLRLYLVNLNFNYTIFQTSRSLLYPGLGLSMMEYRLHLQNKSKTPSSYDEALDRLGGEINMHTDNIAINFSIAYDWALNAEKDYLIGLHAGYRLGLNKPHMKLAAGESLSGAPATSAGGFFAGIDFFVQ